MSIQCNTIIQLKKKDKKNEKKITYGYPYSEYGSI